MAYKNVQYEAGKFKTETGGSGDVTDVTLDGVSVVNQQTGVAELTSPTIPVTDVEVNGTSVVNAQGVAEVPAIPDEVVANPSGTASTALTKLQVGNAIYSISGGGGASALNDLSDVAITSPSNGQGLLYDSASLKFINKTLFDGNSITIPALKSLGGRLVSKYIGASNSDSVANCDFVEFTGGYQDVSGLIIGRSFVSVINFMVDGNRASIGNKLETLIYTQSRTPSRSYSTSTHILKIGVPAWDYAYFIGCCTGKLL